MSNAVELLIAKAMSTDSEEEAISCLRMARKKGNYNPSTNQATIAAALATEKMVHKQNLQQLKKEVDYWKGQAHYYFSLYYKQKTELAIVTADNAKLKTKKNNTFSTTVYLLIICFMLGVALSVSLLA